MRRHRMAHCLVAVVVVTATGLAANAFWLGGGQGVATASTEGVEPVVLSPGSPTEELYPGGFSDVVLTLTNPNDATVRVASLVHAKDQGAAGFTIDDNGECGSSSFSFEPLEAGPGWIVPGSVDGVDGEVTVTLPEALSMDIEATNACQGVMVKVHLASGP